MTNYLIEQDFDNDDFLDEEEMFEDFGEQDDDDFLDDEDESFAEQRRRRRSRVNFSRGARRPLRRATPVQPRRRRRELSADPTPIRAINTRLSTLTNNDRTLRSRIQSVASTTNSIIQVNRRQNRQISRLKQDTDRARQLALFAPLLFQPSLDVTRTNSLDVISNEPANNSTIEGAASTSISQTPEQLKLQNPEQLVADVSLKQQGLDPLLLVLLLNQGSRNSRRGRSNDTFLLLAVLLSQQQDSGQTNSLLPFLLLTLL